VGLGGYRILLRGGGVTEGLGVWGRGGVGGGGGAILDVRGI